MINYSNYPCFFKRTDSFSCGVCFVCGPEKQIEVGDWAVYCLFQKRRRAKKQGVEEKQRVAVGQEFARPCSSCSSGVTEVSSNGTESMDQEESSSGYGYGYGFGLPSSYSSVAHVRGV